MRPVVVLSVATLLISLAGPAIGGDAAQVVIETSRSLYEPGEVVQATVKNERKTTIFVGGCGALVAERLEDESYSPVRGEPCVTEGQAVRIEPGEEMAFEIKEAGKSGEVRRVSLAFGWGCNDERPLSQARCTEFATAASPSFRVGRRQEK
jgi:hypothetical protein